ncbi:MAG: hypothetical protein EOO61_19065 [Hymenobacter sp.]|nr:MAG: hypothetical protein EOO61_19065 [Hymenobacter sp.]
MPAELAGWAPDRGRFEPWQALSRKEQSNRSYQYAGDNFGQSHHPVQNEWAKRNIAGYNEYNAPATLLKYSSTSSHAKLGALQQARRHLPDRWQGTRKDEFNIFLQRNDGCGCA